MVNKNISRAALVFGCLLTLWITPRANANVINFNLVSVAASNPDFLTNTHCCADGDAYFLSTPDFKIFNVDGSGTMDIEYSFFSPDMLFTTIFAYGPGSFSVCNSNDPCGRVHADYFVYDFSRALLASTTFDFDARNGEAFTGWRTIDLSSPVADGLIDVSVSLTTAGSRSGIGSGEGGVLTYFADPRSSLSPVPEPATVVLLGGGLIGAALSRRKANEG